jgi:glucose-6-phosphate 1-dehydrogenase
VRAEVDNWRRHGVPFYLRSGKSMGASCQVMTLGFYQPPLRMFHAHRHDTPTGRVNEIVINFADPGSITVEFMAKVRSPRRCSTTRRRPSPTNPGRGARRRSTS